MHWRWRLQAPANAVTDLSRVILLLYSRENNKIIIQEKYLRA